MHAAEPSLILSFSTVSKHRDHKFKAINFNTFWGLWLVCIFPNMCVFESHTPSDSKAEKPG